MEEKFAHFLAFNPFFSKKTNLFAILKVTKL